MIIILLTITIINLKNKRKLSINTLNAQIVRQNLEYLKEKAKLLLPVPDAEQALKENLNVCKIIFVWYNIYN